MTTLPRCLSAFAIFRNEEAAVFPIHLWSAEQLKGSFSSPTNAHVGALDHRHPGIQSIPRIDVPRIPQHPPVRTEIFSCLYPVPEFPCL